MAFGASTNKTRSRTISTLRRVSIPEVCMAGSDYIAPAPNTNVEISVYTNDGFGESTGT
jgi:hypothetical protein